MSGNDVKTYYLWRSLSKRLLSKMKRLKRGGGTTRRRKAGVNRNSTEVLPTRILRSTKRKLAEAGIVEDTTGSGKRVCTIDSGNDSSDCVIIAEVVPTEAKEKPKSKILTSTPVQSTHSRNKKFSESSVSVKTIEKVNFENDSNDVIVISDSSKSILPSVIVSADEKTDNDIQIIPSTSGKENDKNSNIGKFSLGIVKPKPCSLHINEFSKSHSSKGSRKKRRRDFRFKHLRSNNALMNGGTSNYQGHIGRNVFVENSSPIPKNGLRPIIIDGSNVAFHHSNNKFFSCKGLEICIKYFKIRGHEVIAFVPQYRVKIDKSDNPKLLDQLVRQGDVILTPSRIIDGQPVVSYDDRFIVQTAVLKGGIIVTRDNYRDLLRENPAWAETIKYRLLQFTWVKDILIFPNDPLGPRGPTLEEFLKFS